MPNFLESISIDSDYSNEYLSPSCFWRGHIPTTGLLVQLLQPKLMVDLGVHHGDSLFAFAQSLQKFSTEDYKLVGIDAWEGDIHTGRQDNWIYERVKQLSTNFGKSIELRRSYFEEALSSIDEGSVDLLHIDGLHTYEGVKADYLGWLSKMSPQGVIVFHDICVYKADFGVWQLWNELTQKHPYLCFTHSCGLGVVAVGKELPSLAELLFYGNDKIKYNMTAIASALGKQFTQQYSSPYQFDKLKKIGELAIPKNLQNTALMDRCLKNLRW